MEKATNIIFIIRKYQKIIFILKNIIYKIFKTITIINNFQNMSNFLFY